MAIAATIFVVLVAGLHAYFVVLRCSCGAHLLGFAPFE